MSEAYNAEVDRFKRTGMNKKLDDFVDRSKVRWSSTLKVHLERGDYVSLEDNNIRESIWRPFTKLHLYFDPILNDRLGIMRRAFPNASTEKHNVNICCTSHSQTPFIVQVSNRIMNEAPGGRAGTCFPFYLYDIDGTNRRENITDWALKQFQTHYNDEKIDKLAIFYYTYGLLHSSNYREKFAENLKRELPRIPFSPDFWAFSKAGKKLSALHLHYEQLSPWDLEFVESPDVPLSYRVENKMRFSKDRLRLTFNSSLTLVGIPPAAFEYRLGNRSALEWVVDQYQLSTNKHSGITSDPNRDDDPEYIVRLVGQVIRVSVETMGIVNSLPAYSTE
jgi:predicted helicase